MKRIPRENVRVDRAVCIWLIKKFVDLDAEFVFLPNDTDWKRIHNGTAYDVPGGELGHHGEGVSFDAILRKYGLTCRTYQRSFGVSPASMPNRREFPDRRGRRQSAGFRTP